MSKVTKNCRAIDIGCLLVSILINLAPLIIGVVYAFINGEPAQKFTMGMTITVAVILSVYNLVAKMHLRSVLWVLLLGISFCLNDIKQLLVIMAISTIVDELVFSPLHVHYHSKYLINKEYDERQKVNG